MSTGFDAKLREFKRAHLILTSEKEKETKEAVNI